jgi:hypothetical protein
MRARCWAPGITAGTLTLTLVACNLIVAGKLEDFDGFGRDGGAASSGSVPPCTLTTPPGGESCRDCIVQSCKPELDDACRVDNGLERKESWWHLANECSELPFNGGGWGCKAFENVDGGRIEGSDPSARERNFMVCIRDACVQGGATPPCKK